MCEEKITNRVAQHLKSRGWEIRSLHYPGAQGGLALRRRSRRRVIPDIIATKEGVGVLVVESKSAFSAADAAKVRAVAYSREFQDERARLAKLLGAAGPWFAAAAFAGPRPGNPPDDVVLIVLGPKGVEVHGAAPELRPHLEASGR